MNDKVKVGLDEWLVADAGKVDLITDGLAGCVAVGLAGNGKVSLAHVYSGCEWSQYLPRLEKALRDSDIAGADSQRPLEGHAAVLVYSDDKPTELVDRLGGWLAGKGARIELHQASGCQVSAAVGAIVCTEKNDYAPQPYFDQGFKTTVDHVDGVLAKSALSDLARAAGAAVSQDEVVMLSDGRHPAHALFKHIQDRIPPTAIGYETGEEQLARESSGGLRVAAALTVECMKRGMFDPGKISIDDSALRTSDSEVLHAGVNLGTGYENRVGVHVWEASDKMLSAMSAEAAELLHGHRSQATQNMQTQQQDMVGSHQHM